MWNLNLENYLLQQASRKVWKSGGGGGGIIRGGQKSGWGGGRTPPCLPPSDMPISLSLWKFLNNLVKMLAQPWNGLRMLMQKGYQPIVLPLNDRMRPEKKPTMDWSTQNALTLTFKPFGSVSIFSSPCFWYKTSSVFFTAHCIFTIMNHNEHFLILLSSLTS